MMPAPTAPSSGPGWLSPFARQPLSFGFLLAFVLLVAFHRPILRTALIAALSKAASDSGLVFKGSISGNPLRKVVLENVRVRPPSRTVHRVVDEIKIRRIQMEVSFFSLIRMGPKGCLSSLKVEGMQARLHKDRPASSSNSKASAAVSPLNFIRLSQIPALAPDALDLRDINIEYRDAEKILFRLEGAAFTADPSRAGSLIVSDIRIGDFQSSQTLSATTSYAGRHFTLTNLALTPSLTVDSLSLDASRERHSGNPLLSLSMRSREGGLWVEIRPPNDSAPWTASFKAESFSSCGLLEFLDLHSALGPERFSGTASITGFPLKPKSWKGRAEVSWIQPLPSGEVATARLEGHVGDSQVSLPLFEMRSKSLKVEGSGILQINEGDLSVKSAKGDASVTVESTDLGALLPEGGRLTNTGSGRAVAKFRVAQGVIQADCRADLYEIRAENGAAQKFMGELTLSAPLSRKLRWENVAGNGVMVLQQASLKTSTCGVTMEQASSAISLTEGVVRLWNLRLANAENSVLGEISFPFTNQASPLECKLDFNLKNIASTSLDILGNRTSGAISGSISGKIDAGVIEGTVCGVGSNLRWGGFSLGYLRLNGDSKKGVLALTELNLGWNPQEALSASGSIDLSAPFGYEIDATATLPKLERISPLLSQLGMAGRLGGQMEGSWQGKGDLQSLTGSGHLRIKLKEAHWNALVLNALECVARYDPEKIQTETFRIITPTTKLGLMLEWGESSLSLQNIALEQWGRPTLSGYMILPVTRSAKGVHWIEEARLAGQLRAENLDIASLLIGAGKPAAVYGTVNCSIAMSGTASNPSAAFNLQTRNIRLQAAPKFGPLELDVTGNYADGALLSDAVLRSPLNAPVKAELKFPFPVATLFSNISALGKLPMSARVQTTNASLQPLALAWTGLRQITGNASLDATLEGCLDQPNWTAKFRTDCPIVHFASDRFPAISELHAAVEFDGKQLRIQTLKGDLGGGSLQVQGTASFKEPENPVLDFSAKASEVLVIRNRNLSVRLNGDLFLRGPWNRALIGGSAAAVKSRVQRDIDVLPVTALRNGSSGDARPAGKPWFTLKSAPFSDWRYDVSLSSTPGDPILLRGNRLRGSADAELKLEGTGATPTLHGAYRTNNLVASLPFARVEMSRGRVWYTREQPFIPHIDFSCETEVRNHRVRIYLSGSPETPNVSISSEPPLGETELLSLITTGSLPTDANENSQALASRAATVLFQEFSDKVFKPSNGESLSALRRFSLDLSALNSRTGHQESRLTYRIQNNLFLIGEIGADGDFAGRFRYVLQFR